MYREPIRNSAQCVPALQVPDPKLKYQQLLAYGKKLPKMPQEDHTDENKVRGCVSQVGCSLALEQAGSVWYISTHDRLMCAGLSWQR